MLVAVLETYGGKNNNKAEGTRARVKRIRHVAPNYNASVWVVTYRHEKDFSLNTQHTIAKVRGYHPKKI